MIEISGKVLFLLKIYALSNYQVKREPLMNFERHNPAASWPYIGLFFLITTVAVVAGYFYYISQKNELMENNLQELTTISDLKIRQIVLWRQERIADGKVLSRNIPFKSQIYQFLDGERNNKIADDLSVELKAMTENYDYKSILLLDKNDNVRLYYPGQDTIIGDYLKNSFDEIKSAGDVVLTDLHYSEKVSFVHLDIVVPLRRTDLADTSVFGFLLFRIDPGEILYPLLKLWPVPNKSSETLLFHQEGDEIVYLNELRHLNNTELKLRKPVTEKNLASVMALQGIRQTTNAVDYRNVPVVAVMNKIPDTQWYMVAKIDKSEIMGGLNRSFRQVLIIIILFILTTGLFLGILLRKQRERYYREKYEAELDRQALIKHFDYILKYANDIILLADDKYNIVEANDKAIETYQYDRKSFIGKNVRQLRSDSSIEYFESDTKQLHEAGSLTFETVHKRKDGSEFPIEISAREVEIEGKKYFQSICRDITERKNAETILKESESKFRKVFEDSPVCMVMTGKDMGIIMVNSAFSSMIGYPEEELIGMTFRNITHPEHIQKDEISILKLVAEEIPIYHTEKRYIRSDGREIWGSTTVCTIRNEKEEVQFFLAMIEDITQRKITEAELENSFSLISATLESTADGILVVDNDGNIVQHNQKFVQLWNIPDDVLGTRKDNSALDYVFNQVLYPDNFISQIRKLYSDPEAVTSDLIEFKDGRYFERYSQPHKIAGKTVGRVWSFRDITERKMAEKELIAAKEKAEENDRLKTAFLHNVSHEIRTPMNAILGFSALLEDEGLSEEDRHQFIEIIAQSGNQLLSIINDIVDLASIESGQVKLKLKAVNLNATLRGVCEQFSYKESSAGVKVNLKIDDNEEISLLTDGTKLVQILTNLINNALKFTRKGTIDLGYNNDGKLLEFFVRDTGIGIAPEFHAKIFDRFYQVDNAVSRQYTGTGLGLSICKAYVELLGGKIWLHSEVGEGTTFYFTIPLIT